MTTSKKKFKPRVSRGWLEQEYVAKRRDRVQAGTYLTWSTASTISRA